MKVIFVGIHNKPGLEPLCSSTKSGKLVDRIIELIPLECVKTNLYDSNTMPSSKNKHREAINWHNRVYFDKNDIIVLLGNEVQNNFVNMYNHRVVNLSHPSYIWSNLCKTNYVSCAVDAINNILKSKYEFI